MTNLEKYRSLLHDGVQGLLLTSRYSRMYAAEFDIAEGVAVVSAQGARYFTDSRYIESAQKNLKGFEVVEIGLNNPMMQALNTTLDEFGVETLGFEDEYLTVAELNGFEAALPVKFVPLQKEINAFRASKEDWELARMRKAQEITDRAFTEVCTRIHTGMTEKELEAELIYCLYKNGAEGLSFDPIVVSGPNTSMPHGVAGSRVLQDGDFVTMDFGVLYQGYCSDMTRTVALGHATEERSTTPSCAPSSPVLRPATQERAARASTALPATSSRRPATARISATAMATASVSRSTKRRIAPRATRTRSLPALCAPQSRASTFRANSASASRMS